MVRSQTIEPALAGPCIQAWCTWRGSAGVCDKSLRPSVSPMRCRHVASERAGYFVGSNPAAPTQGALESGYLRWASNPEHHPDSQFRRGSVANGGENMEGMTAGGHNVDMGP